MAEVKIPNYQVWRNGRGFWEPTLVAQLDGVVVAPRLSIFNFVQDHAAWPSLVHEDLPDVGVFGAVADATDLVVRTCRHKRAKEVYLADFAEFVWGLAVSSALQLFGRR